MKSIILLTTAVFLVSAPSPDSKTISEMSAGFLSPTSETALVAAEVAPKKQLDSKPAKQLPDQTESEKTRSVK